MILLCRRHRSDPLEITTAPAPVLGGPHVDVAADAASIVVPDVPAPAWVPVDFETDVPVVVAPDPRLEFVDGRPAVDRGQCYHDVHFEHDGRRFGALIHPHQHSASLLPCPYLGKAGR